MEHIVISSAGPNGFIQLGMLAQLMETFTIDTIQSIRGTSAGSMLAVLLCLKVPIEEVVDYFIKRPLHKWFKMDVSLFMKNNGLVTSALIDLLSPLFHVQDVPLTITMKELFDLSSIDLHIYTTSVIQVESVDINHTTFPDLPVIQAIAMSCAIPLLFPPIEYNGNYYVDGGLLMHCPIPPNEKTIVLYIKDIYTFSMDSPFHMLSHILLKSLCRLSPPITVGKIFEYEADIHGLDPNLWESILTDETLRAKMIQQGKEHIQNLRFRTSLEASPDNVG